VPVLPDRVDRDAAGFRARRESLLALLEEHSRQLALANQGGGQKYVERHRQRGKLLARERVELLLDPDSPFLELSPLAAWGTDYVVGASLVTGIGVVEGTEVMVVANDPTVRGGAINPYSARRQGRALQIANENRLPLVNLVESGGADLPTQSEIFIPGGAGFRDLTRKSAAGIPTVSLVFGNSTAGGAYVPGMSDYVVMVEQRAKVFLGGPPLVKMATGEVSEDEELGGAEMHARTSGLADYLAADEVIVRRHAPLSRSSGTSRCRIARRADAGHRRPGARHVWSAGRAGPAAGGARGDEDGAHGGEPGRRTRHGGLHRCGAAG
jgi:acyl-CoA carboxylase subunit beta